MMLAVAAPSPIAEGHYMSPTGVGVLFLLAFVVDFLSVFPVWIRDRIAFSFATAAIWEGFNGSVIDSWTIGKLIDGLQWCLDREVMSGAYIAGAVPAVLLSIGVFAVWLYCLGCILPAKLSKKAGRVMTISFSQSGLFQINARLWILAAVLGLFADLPRAALGIVVEGSVDSLTAFVAPVPLFLVGVV